MHPSTTTTLPSLPSRLLSARYGYLYTSERAEAFEMAAGQPVDLDDARKAFFEALAQDTFTSNG
jgi:hypothetical protein